MLFHENRLLAHVILLPYFCRKLGKMSQNVSSAAVVIGALRVKNTGRLAMYLCQSAESARQSLL